MPMKGRGTAEYRTIDRWDGGVGWLAYPNEQMQRASHALVGDDDGVWVFDPVDAPDLDDLFAEYGEVSGVVVGLDRHKRDAARVANRHDAPVYVADWMTGVADEINAPVERFGRRLGDSGFDAFTVKDSSLPPWQEVGFHHEESGTLLVPEAVGTAPYFRAPDERLGVHPMLRPLPPRRPLRRYDPERVLVGHGEGVLNDAGTALRAALSGARKNIPNVYGKAIREMLS
ncbi:hypothetical protein C474_19664 [Halogeometricum pallidum JCM 14848]|uniref:Uncharacterized protein n=1 Tax=Halogeometricum pallidum JCM 14848 TaxID=1227487 RepID=M0CWY7_HALPD|nr:hypothetical protein [Halogeometricum pallidum]ELZ26399.1 hypothetical protein C474_19664 [Halogeometricum pallidum JCM 14848]